MIATVDEMPVVAVFGDTPMWRDLDEGSEGEDVRQLEANLAALGYDPDGTVDIDETYTANTSAMVARWQEDLAVEATGDVARRGVVVVPGPSTIVSVAEVGGSAAGGLAELAPRSVQTDVVAEVDGVVTGIAPVGTSLSHGTTAYLVDELPVVVLTETDAVADVLLDPDRELIELEQTLADQGHDPDGEDDRRRRGHRRHRGGSDPLADLGRPTRDRTDRVGLLRRAAAGPCR